MTKKNESHVFQVEDTAFRVIDRKEFTVKLKKKGFLFFGPNEMDEKKFKLSELASKCDVTKDITFGKIKATIQLKFSVHTPIKGKEYEEVKSQKLVIDSYLPPFRGLPD